jgi:branched-subunit amino acid transport protein AzlD
MGMLVIYCLRSTSLSSLGGFLPTVISCATVILLHVWKRNTLLSIMCGTLSYMLLVQFVF